MNLIYFTTADNPNPQLGYILRDYGFNKYLVLEDCPTKGQPATRFVFNDQVVCVVVL